MPDIDTTLPASSQPSLRDDIDIGGQAGLATYVAAKIFGSAPLPPGAPAWLRESIDTQANFAQRLPGTDAMTIGNVGGGPVTLKTKRDQQRDADAKAIAYMSDRLDQAERERQQWDEQRHGIAGVEMTGKEWHEFADRLRNDEDLKQRILDAYRSRGMTTDEAEQRYKRVADVAEAMATPKSQRSEDQEKSVSQAEADSSFKDDIRVAHKLASDRAPATGISQTKTPTGYDTSQQQAATPVTFVNGPGF